MTATNRIRIIMLSIGLLSAVPVMSVAQSAQPSTGAGRVDPRWTPYLGCWRLLQENVRSARVPPSDVMMVCVAPTGTGVTMTTYAAGRAILTQTIVADGQPQPVNEADCQGTQINDWSRDGERLFTRVEVACSGRARRTVSGVTLVGKGPAWLDVQAIDVDGTAQVRIRRYQRTSERPADVAELPADIAARAAADLEVLSAGTMSLEDVIEASQKISPAALEAVIDETGARFALNSRALKQLANAGVSPDVIDLMVAQSFPDQFHVDRASSLAPQLPSSIAAGGTSIIYNGFPGSLGYPYYDPYYDPYYSYYSYFSPFAYPYWGSSYYYRNYYNGVPTLIVPGGSIGGGTVTSPAESSGVVVNGRGYTRVTSGSPSSTAVSSGESAPTSNTRSSPRGTRSSGDGGSSSSGGSVVSGSGYSSGSGGSSGGGSSSSGGDSGGRTAQPR